MNASIFESCRRQAELLIPLLHGDDRPVLLNSLYQCLVSEHENSLVTNLRFSEFSLLSVGDLLQEKVLLASSFSSAHNTKYLLIGCLELAVPPGHSDGILKLFDLQNRNWKLSVELQNPSTKFLNQILLVTEWNLRRSSQLIDARLTTQSTFCLEVVSARRLLCHSERDEETKSMQLFRPLSVCRAYCTLEHAKAARKSTAKKSKRVCISGRLLACSPIIEPSGSSAYFLTIFEDLLSDAQIPILFAGAHIVWHPLLRVNRTYIVTNLSISILSPGKPRQRHLWTCKTNDRDSTKVLECSETVLLNFSPADQTETQSEVNPQSAKRVRIMEPTQSPSFCTPLLQARPPHPFIVAEITGYLRNAVYELDRKYSLFLSHSSHSGRGLRIGAIVRLHNIHEVVICGRVVGYGCCTRSSIEVFRFSPLLDKEDFLPDCSPYRSLCQSLTIPQYAHVLQLAEDLNRKFHLSRKQLLESQPGGGNLFSQILAAIPLPKFERDIYEEFLDHQMTNCAVCAPLSHAPSLISLSLFCERVRVAFVRSLPSQLSLTRDDVRNMFLEDFLLLGRLESDADGVLRLVDTTGSVPIQISDPLDDHSVINSGDICLIKTYRLIRGFPSSDAFLYVTQPALNIVTIAIRPAISLSEESKRLQKLFELSSSYPEPEATPHLFVLVVHKYLASQANGEVNVLVVEGKQLFGPSSQRAVGFVRDVSIRANVRSYSAVQVGSVYFVSPILGRAVVDGVECRLAEKDATFLPLYFISSADARITFPAGPSASLCQLSVNAKTLLVFSAIRQHHSKIHTIHDVLRVNLALDRLSIVETETVSLRCKILSRSTLLDDGTRAADQTRVGDNNRALACHFYNLGTIRDGVLLQVVSADEPSSPDCAHLFISGGLSLLARCSTRLLPGLVVRLRCLLKRVLCQRVCFLATMRTDLEFEEPPTEESLLLLYSLQDRFLQIPTTSYLGMLMLPHNITDRRVHCIRGSIEKILSVIFHYRCTVCKKTFAPGDIICLGMCSDTTNTLHIEVNFSLEDSTAEAMGQVTGRDALRLLDIEHTHFAQLKSVIVSQFGGRLLWSGRRSVWANHGAVVAVPPPEVTLLDERLTEMNTELRQTRLWYVRSTSVTLSNIQPREKPCQEFELLGDKRYRCPTLYFPKMSVDVLDWQAAPPRAELLGLLSKLEGRWMKRCSSSSS